MGLFGPLSSRDACVDHNARAKLLEAHAKQQEKADAAERRRAVTAGTHAHGGGSGGAHKHKAPPIPRPDPKEQKRKQLQSDLEAFDDLDADGPSTSARPQPPRRPKPHAMPGADRAATQPRPAGTATIASSRRPHFGASVRTDGRATKPGTAGGAPARRAASGGAPVSRLGGGGGGGASASRAGHARPRPRPPPVAPTPEWLREKRAAAADADGARPRPMYGPGSAGYRGSSTGGGQHGRDACARDDSMRAPALSKRPGTAPAPARARASGGSASASRGHARMMAPVRGSFYPTRERPVSILDEPDSEDEGFIDDGDEEFRELEDAGDDWRAEMRSLTGYDPRRFADDGDDREMVAGWREVQAEERRSARLGHDEDEREELAERKRVAQKDAKKKAKRRKANGSFLDV